MTKIDYLDKHYHQFIKDIAKTSIDKSVTVVVLNGAKGSNFNSVLNDISKIGKIQRVVESTFITKLNLTKIFSSVHRNQQSILFFDEADALFGKRSKVKDSHDRYANIETSYLLGKIKKHHGLIILATNNRQSLSVPLASEITILIEFPAVLTFVRKYYWRIRKSA